MIEHQNCGYHIQCITIIYVYTNTPHTVDREIFAVIIFCRYCIMTKIKNMKFFNVE